MLRLERACTQAVSAALTCTAALLQGCKWHKPDGCPNEGLNRCPYCLTMPALNILQNIANHLELVKGAKGVS